jgi:hypothetical protein
VYLDPNLCAGWNSGVGILEAQLPKTADSIIHEYLRLQTGDEESDTHTQNESNTSTSTSTSTAIKDGAADSSSSSSSSKSADELHKILESRAVALLQAIEDAAGWELATDFREIPEPVNTAD